MAEDLTTEKRFANAGSSAGESTASRMLKRDAGSITSKETVCLVLWTVLADWLIFRTLGFAGPAVFFASVPALFLARRWKDQSRFVASLLIGLLWCVAARLVWSGSSLGVFSGVLLTVALALTASGIMPFVLETLLYLTHVWLSGLLSIAGFGIRSSAASSDESDVVATPGSEWSYPTGNAPRNNQQSVAGPTTSPAETAARGALIAWLMPVIAAIVFGGIFVFANPDLLTSVWSRCTQTFNFAWTWIEGMSIWEIPFCLFAFVVGAGLVRPIVLVERFGSAGQSVSPEATGHSPLYGAFRNTLMTLIVLFSVYLLFEFGTLWGRTFPNGFYYAGYAHQGAAWLTFALALATGLLSAAFSSSVLHDKRSAGLRKLAWIWSAQNFLLAAAVYNRLMIYVSYNGMTRMRTIGFFGITLVVIGFALVLIKIRDHRGFWWLIRAQLIAMVLTVMAYGLFPVDWVAHRYNASCVVAGNLHPSVMIAVKPIEDEGMLPLIGLVEVEDDAIREGVRALLAQRQHEIQSDWDLSTWHWTKYQGAKSYLYQRLSENQSQWDRYLENPDARQVAIDNFHDYAMQWY